MYLIRLVVPPIVIVKIISTINQSINIGVSKANGGKIMHISQNTTISINIYPKNLTIFANMFQRNTKKFIF